jgi:hypothetical protein
VDQAPESRFLLDSVMTEREERLREQRLHLIDVLRLRLLDFAILTALLIFH